MPGNRLGRPILLTPELAATIAEFIAAGNYMETTAKLVCIHERSIYRWLERGKAEESGIYYDFWQAIQKAEATAEMVHLATIMRAAKDDPKWAAWYLSHKHPERWSENRQELLDLLKRVKELEKQK